MMLPVIALKTGHMGAMLRRFKFFSLNTNWF